MLVEYGRYNWENMEYHSRASTITKSTIKIMMFPIGSEAIFYLAGSFLAEEGLRDELRLVLAGLYACFSFLTELIIVCDEVCSALL
jgi:hypothetical protein